MEQEISKYISYDEATKTHRKLPNQPNAAQLQNIQYLCVHLLDVVRDHFNSPIVLNSLFRSKMVNDATPGSSETSEHLCNNNSAAADIIKCGDNLFDVFKYIKDNLDFNQMILESVDDINNPKTMGWLHVSIKRVGKNRKEILVMKNKKYYPWKSLYNAIRPKWRKVVIRKGNHFSGFRFSPFVIYKQPDFVLSKTYRFTQESRYDFNDQYGKEMINKLFGISFGLNHKLDSVRIGWKFNNDIKKYLLYGYIRKNGQLSTVYITTVEEYQLFRGYIQMHDNCVSFVVYKYNIKDDIYVDGTASTGMYMVNRKNYGYKLFEYFGGDYSAPSNIKFLNKVK